MSSKYHQVEVHFSTAANKGGRRKQLLRILAQENQAPPPREGTCLFLSCQVCGPGLKQPGSFWQNSCHSQGYYSSPPTFPYSSLVISLDLAWQLCCWASGLFLLWLMQPYVLDPVVCLPWRILPLWPEVGAGRGRRQCAIIMRSPWCSQPVELFLGCLACGSGGLAPGMPASIDKEHIFLSSRSTLGNREWIFWAWICPAYKYWQCLALQIHTCVSNFFIICK